MRWIGELEYLIRHGSHWVRYDSKFSIPGKNPRSACEASWLLPCNDARAYDFYAGYSHSPWPVSCTVFDFVAVYHIVHV